MTPFVALLSVASLSLTIAYATDVLCLVRWFFGYAAPAHAPTLPAQHDSGDIVATTPPSKASDLTKTLLRHLDSRDVERRRRAETLLAHAPTAPPVAPLLALLSYGPWDERALAAARLLLTHGDEEVIEPLHRFFSRQEGGIAAYLGTVAVGETSAAWSRTVPADIPACLIPSRNGAEKVVSMFEPRRRRHRRDR